MAFTVKQKIRWGTLFLFILLLLLGAVGIFHIVRLKNDSQVILKDNYESLDYCHAMQRALDSVAIKSEIYLKAFDSLLRRQEANVTEPGEKKATNTVRHFFDRYVNGERTPEVLHEIRASIQAVLALNMSAIEHKNARANITANKALSYISLIAAIIFLIGLTFSFNFPSIVTGPINAFTEGIREVGAKNYGHRIHLDRKDEFGKMAVAFNDMAGRLEYFESSNLNKIIFEKTRAEAVINSLKDASIGVDANGTILFANQQALQLLGIPAAQVVAAQVDEVARKNDLFRFLMDDKGTMPFKVVVDNHENYFIKETIDISEDSSGGKVIVLKNITSFKELDVAKTNFIATISHELKTPLAASDFSITLLEDQRVGTLSEEQRQLVKNLRQDNQRMLKILSELLNMAQVEAGKIQLTIQTVSPYQIAENAIASVAGTASEKKISIVRNFPHGLPSVAADPDKTTWVLNNFLTNAIKYSPNESDVGLQMQAIDGMVQFSVSDQGPGIAPVYQSKIFDRFFKVPGSDSTGNGLGLAISREFIETQKGRIWVNSELGAGSTFSIELPCSAG